MILVLIALFVVAFFVSFVLITKKTLRVVASIVSFVALVASLTLLIQNDKYHFGMKEVAHVTTHQIFTAVPKTPSDLLLYQQVGKGTEENVYIYKRHADSKATHTQTDGKTVNCVFFTSDKHATLEVTTIRYEYKDTLYKVLFGLGHNETVVSRNNTFNLPKSWLKISTTNAKKLAKMTKDMTPAQKQAQEMAAKEVIGAQVKAAIMANPKLATDPSAQAEIVKQATAKFQQKAFADIVNKLEK